MICQRPTITDCCERWKSAWESRTGIVSFVGKRLGDDTIESGAAEVIDSSGDLDATTDLTIDDVSPNLEPVTIGDCEVPAGHGITMGLSGGTKGQTYRIRVRGTTLAGQDIEGVVYLAIV